MKSSSMPVVPAVLAHHLPKGPSREDPFMQGETTDAQGVLDVLARPGAISVERDAEAVDPKPGHGLPLLFVV